MPTAAELFQAGQLQPAVDAQTAKVRSAPADRAARFFLFELLAFAGDLDRCRKQLDVLRYDDPQHTAAVDQYRFALDAEAGRREVFAGKGQPTVLRDAPDHVFQRLDAIKAAAAGDAVSAAEKLAVANAAVPSLRWAVDGRPTDGVYDADERFGTVIEVFGTAGTYTWVPLEQVQSLTFAAVAAPRDVLFRPAHLELTDGFEGDVLVPGLYPGSHAHPDDAVRLGRETAWAETAPPAGGRLYLIGDATVSLADLTRLVVAS